METQCKQGCLLNYQRAQAHPARRHGRDPARRRHGGHRRGRSRRVLRRPAAAGRHRARGAPRGSCHRRRRRPKGGGRAWTRAARLQAGDRAGRPGGRAALLHDEGAGPRRPEPAGDRGRSGAHRPARRAERARGRARGRAAAADRGERRHARRRAARRGREPRPGDRPARSPAGPASFGAPRASRRRGEARRRHRAARHGRGRGGGRDRPARRLGAGGAAVRRPRRRRAVPGRAGTPAPVHAAGRPLRGHVRPGPARARRAAVGRRMAPPGEERALRGRRPQCQHRAVAPGPRREPEADARRGDRRRVLPHADRGGDAAGDARRPHDPRGRGARHPRAHLHLHHRDGRLVLEPDPQRPPDGGLRGRHDHRARRLVLVQRSRRSAHLRARLPARGR